MTLQTSWRKARRPRQRSSREVWGPSPLPWASGPSWGGAWSCRHLRQRHLLQQIHHPLCWKRESRGVSRKRKQVRPHLGVRTDPSYVCTLHTRQPSRTQGRRPSVPARVVTAPGCGCWASTPGDEEGCLLISRVTVGPPGCFFSLYLLELHTEIFMDERRQFSWDLLHINLFLFLFFFFFWGVIGVVKLRWIQVGEELMTGWGRWEHGIYLRIWSLP